MRLRPILYILIILVEDRRFFKHHGFDLIAMLRAAFVCLKKWKFAQGGSTITQQLARTLFLNNKKTIARKLQEIFIAIEIERRLSKEQILELYVRSVYMGPGLKGIPQAAKFHYGKDLKDCNVYEIASLVAMIKGPNSYKLNSKLLKDRTDFVLNKYFSL
jgi:penicillin-binding protein 1A